MTRPTWVQGAAGSPYDVDNLPYAVFGHPDAPDDPPRLGVRIGDQVLDLAPDHRARGASFDRFGLFNVQSGGPFVEIYLDDLSYTVGPGGR